MNIDTTIHNLNVVREALEAEGLTQHVKLIDEAIADLRAVPELVKALELQEKADEFHANCEECGGEEIPELCRDCFPLFDAARIARRTALAKVKL